MWQKTHIKGRKKGRIKRTKMHEIAVKIVSIKELKGRIKGRKCGKKQVVCA